jgi:hypothetical protein
MKRMSVTRKPRRPYPRRRQPRKTVFTAAMWSRWLSEQGWVEPPDEKTLRCAPASRISVAACWLPPARGRSHEPSEHNHASAQHC